jgi:hypothetical protein
MKTPTEKSKELTDKFYEYSDGTGSCERFYDDLAVENAKKCAIIMVDEILAFMKLLKWDKKTNGNVLYWQEVRKEITRKRV